MDQNYEVYESNENNECPLCGGHLEYFGTLGIMMFLKCRHCGMQFRQEVYDV